MFRWHADIKPDNILFVENRLQKEKDDTKEEGDQPKQVQNESTFKLADPGFAKFVKKSQDESTEVPKHNLSGGTETYGRRFLLPGQWRGLAHDAINTDYRLCRCS